MAFRSSEANSLRAELPSNERLVMSSSSLLPVPFVSTFASPVRVPFRLVSPRLRPSSRFTAGLLALSACLLSCGPTLGLPTDEDGRAIEVGRASFALTAETETKSYALRDALFAITGAETFTLDSRDQPEADTLSLEVPSGPYAVELSPGYRLVEVTAGGDVEVQATLETPNPQSVLVSPEQVTTVTYLFRTAGTPVSFGPGSLAIAIQVEQAETPGLVISEFMVNPSAVSDSAGEWIELTNTSDAAITLDDCRVLRDGTGFTVDPGLSIPANGRLTLANGASPGFSPGYVYSGMTLPNSAAFILSLECSGAVVDAVAIDPSAWPLASGISAALDPSALSAKQNDSASAWCLSTKSYGTDFGTPGDVNDTCTQ